MDHGLVLKLVRARSTHAPRRPSRRAPRVLARGKRAVAEAGAQERAGNGEGAPGGAARSHGMGLPVSLHFRSFIDSAIVFIGK